MNLDNKLLKDIESYCSINCLDLDKYINGLLKKAFMTDKYGERPPFLEKKTGVIKENESTETVVDEIVDKKPEKIIIPVETKKEEAIEDKEPEVKVVIKKTTKPRTTRKRKLD